MEIYPIIFIECTFIDPEHIEESMSRKHLHWNDIEPYVQKNVKIHNLILFILVVDIVMKKYKSLVKK